VLLDAVTEYTNQLDAGPDGDEFQLDGFAHAQPGGFADGALHTAHDYPANADATAMLRRPVTLSTATTLSFDEVVLVEPGETGSQYGDYDFWDYVVVEGTADGVTWLPLADGYDARADAAWLNAWYGGQDGSAALYRSRAIDLNATFDQGETVLLRFRLFSDGYVEGWGWAVDDVAVESSGTTAAGDAPAALALGQNHPNPFNPQTTISFDLPRESRVRLEVYDLRGRLRRTLADGHRTAGTHRVVWDGRDDRGAPAASGAYFYRLQTGDRTLSRKMLLVR
jgi:hypothetical protein